MCAYLCTWYTLTTECQTVCEPSPTYAPITHNDARRGGSRGGVSAPPHCRPPRVPRAFRTTGWAQPGAGFAEASERASATATTGTATATTTSVATAMATGLMVTVATTRRMRQSARWHEELLERLRHVFAGAQNFTHVKRTRLWRMQSSSPLQPLSPLLLMMMYMMIACDCGGTFSPTCCCR